MRKTKFTLWLEELGGLQKKLHDVHSLSDVSETITIDGKLITINLGKEYNAELSDSSYPIAPRHLRPLYTNNKEAFDALLESLKQATETVVLATDTILTAISEEALPGAVMARMKGEQVSGESPDLVKDMAEKKLKELYGRVCEQMPKGIWNQFKVTLPIADRELELETWRSQYSETVEIKWGTKLHVSSSRCVIDDVEQAMYFLANFDVIKAKLQKLLYQIDAIKV